MEFKPGFGHGGLPDRDKIKDMYPAVRHSVPSELTWELTGGDVRDFFWLHTDSPASQQEIDARCQDNRITITTSANVTSFRLGLDQRLIDFHKPVTLEINGMSTTRDLKPSLRTLAQSLLDRGDPQLAFTTPIDWSMPASP